MTKALALENIDKQEQEEFRTINKREFLSLVAQKNGMTVAETTRAYDALVEGITDVVSEGHTLTLSGFGSFFLQKHKGHPIHFEKRGHMPDYVVFKFSASKVLSKEFREAYNRGEVKVSK